MQLPHAAFKTVYRMTNAVPAIIFISTTPNDQTLRVLVFFKTEGFHPASIDAGKKAFSQMATGKGFAADFTEDATKFTTANLKQYNAVVF